MSAEKTNEINKLKALMDNLVQYRDCEIIHTFNNLSLTYCNDSKTFVLKDTNNGETDQYIDSETCSLAIYERLESNEVAQ